MGRVSDLSDLEELVARLDWLCMSLAGTEDEEGLLPLLDRLFVEGDAPSQSGLLPRVESLYLNGERLLTHFAQVADVLEHPIGNDLRNSIRQSVSDAVSTEREAMAEDLADVEKAARLAGERITEAAAKAEMSAQSTQAELLKAEESLQSAGPAMAEQMRAMVSEMKGILAKIDMKGPLEDTLRKTIENLAVDDQTTRLQETWAEAMASFHANMTTDIRQHQEAIEAMLVESQQEQLSRVKKIIDSRTPSDTIIQLFDDLDRTKARLAQYEDGAKDAGSQLGMKTSKPNSTRILVPILAALAGAIVSLSLHSFL